jgi:hypothetical protein
VAGVSITTAKNALRAARGLNIISVEERRLTAFRNASNVVRITSPEWRAWLRLGGGVKSAPPSPIPYKNQRSRTSKLAWAAEGQRGPRGAPQRDSYRSDRTTFFVRLDAHAAHRTEVTQALLQPELDGKSLDRQGQKDRYEVVEDEAAVPASGASRPVVAVERVRLDSALGGQMPDHCWREVGLLVGKRPCWRQ